MISIIFPTYNEAENIEELVERTAKTLKKDFEIVVVDDNSPDGTAKKVLQMQKNQPFLKLILRKGKRGLAPALEEAIKKAKGEILGWMDADLTMPPEKFSEMIAKLKEFDLVVGSRLMRGGRDRRGNQTTKCLSVILNKFIVFLLGGEITDWTSGFICLKREVFKKVSIDKKGDHGSYFLSLLFEARREGFKISEVPYVLEKRRFGRSKVTGTPWQYTYSGLKYLTTALRLKFYG